MRRFIYKSDGIACFACHALLTVIEIRFVNILDTPSYQEPTRSLATSANDVVNIVEVGPRDGLQNEKGTIPVNVKVELINRLARAGAQNIETGSFVSPKWGPQRLDNLISLLDETQLTPPMSDEISIFTAASDAFIRTNLNMTTAESLQRLEPAAHATPDRGLRIRGCALVDMGCYEVGLDDTVGQGTPTKVTEMIEEVKKGVPVEKLAFHDTYDTAVADVFAALAQAIRTIDFSVGGCPVAGSRNGMI
ncbi:hypothetical protein DXG01_000566 [Tephrocybe rancida]|nr:hypothetical protein DXG01_000566 [Tephrocybe rancida]